MQQITVRQIGVVALRDANGDFLSAEPIYINAASPNIKRLYLQEKDALEEATNIMNKLINQKQKENKK